MINLLSYVTSEASNRFFDYVKGFSNRQLVRIAQSAIPIFYLHHLRRMGKYDDSVKWIYFGALLGMFEKTKKETLPVSILVWDVDYVVTTHPLIFLWFPMAVAINFLYAKVRGGRPDQVLNVVFSIKAGVVLIRCLRRSITKPRVARPSNET